MMMKKGASPSHTFIGTRALVVGLAREGTALTRFLVERGAEVTVTDVKPAEALADRVAALAGLPVSYALGGHPLRLLDSADILFVSPGVPLEIPLLVEARKRGLPLSSETRLFTRLCPAMVVGITGSSGKTTTTALVGEMLKSAGWHTWVGGNIGRPLIGHLDEMRPTETVIMELSSFQLEFFAAWSESVRELGGAARDGVLFETAGWSPPISAVLNVTPNHLDRHPTMETYIAAKAQILEHQRAGDVAVLNLDNRVTQEMGQLAERRGQRVLWFSLERDVEEGAFSRGDELVLRLGGQEEVLCRVQDLKLLGRHNLANVLAAFALAAAVSATFPVGAGLPRGEAGPLTGGGDLPVEALRCAVTSFSGVEHRLELVRKRNGVLWYNDSIATTPERTVAALRSFDLPIILLAGGRDKHLPWDEMATLTWRKVRHLVLFGEAADLIEGAMRESEDAAGDSPYPTQLHHAGSLQRAVELANLWARPGDLVLLSPGGTSFDAYADFAARGEHFRQLVRSLE
jgi:UDP-N-acetylmuramoylalanine--D-glutamate ligase